MFFLNSEMCQEMTTRLYNLVYILETHFDENISNIDGIGPKGQNSKESDTVQPMQESEGTLEPENEESSKGPLKTTVDWIQNPSFMVIQKQRAN